MTTGSGGYWKVAVVEDHLFQRQHAVDLLRAQEDLRVVCSAESMPAFLRWLRTAEAHERPHLLVLDLVVDRGPWVSPDDVRQLVRSGIRVLIFSEMSSPPLLRRVLQAGASGVVGKRDSESAFLEAVRTIVGLGRWMSPESDAVLGRSTGAPLLSDQEERTLVLYASGLTLPQVAVELGVKPETAKTYLDRVKAKYAAAGRPARSKVELNRIAVADGYVDPLAPAAHRADR
ncbi:MAG TPA: response regulator transcription factor [Marmoricola sp.]|jgi:DNA-binding NarL/FixJ family response regulator|nr:response regulator transcription factor [Marmoricola sp.]